MKCPLCKTPCEPGILEPFMCDELIEVCYCSACNNDFYGRSYNVREMSIAEFGAKRQQAKSEDETLLRAGAKPAANGREG